MSGYGQNYSAPAAAPAGGAVADAFPKQPIIAGIAGAALAFLGSFLAWTTVEGAEGGMSAGSETVGGMDGDGMFTLITALLAIGLFAFGLVKRNAMAAAGAAVPALIALVFAVLNVLDPERLARTYVEDEAGGQLTGEDLDMVMESFEFSTAFGLYVVLVGALVAVGAGVFAGVKGRSA
ncbi:hypothetical protein [Streptomyces litchfieldiae]|uniref:Integral membrane protein n=1 Tax=Streptomyces litchfieldiae TaxID=3075543 RepID=A0ABU2MNN6_9ACTN|nr:hypothetical protein [Streptomyces sp. DSM 44938]MDT0343237.1 hypothetical protein [Streptomyces sp. DSM 44938]